MGAYVKGGAKMFSFAHAATGYVPGCGSAPDSLELD